MSSVLSTELETAASWEVWEEVKANNLNPLSEVKCPVCSEYGFVSVGEPTKGNIILVEWANCYSCHLAQAMRVGTFLMEAQHWKWMVRTLVPGDWKKPTLFQQPRATFESMPAATDWAYRYKGL